MKKLFRSFSLCFLLVVLFTTMTFPAGQISFISPTQGQIITLIGDRSTVPVNILYGFRLDPNYSIPSYQKLFAPPVGDFETSQETSLPQWEYLPAGTYSWRIELWQYNGIGQPVKTAEQTITFSVKFKTYCKEFI